MDATLGTMRELTSEELGLVSGAFSWGEMGGHMVLGAGIGAMVGAAGAGVGAGPGALAGFLIGGIEYGLGELIEQYF